MWWYAGRRETIMIKEYQLKDGIKRYLVQVYLGKDSDGKVRKTTRRGFKTPKEAKIAEARLLNQNPIHEPKHQTYSEIYTQWESEYEGSVRESTFQKTSTIFRLHILPVLGDKRIDLITPKHIQAIVNQWAKDFVKYKIMVRYMDKVFKKAIRLDYIHTSPIDKITYPKSKKESVNIGDNFYNAEQLALFLQALERENSPKWLAAFRLLAYSGMRQGELLALTWEDFDIQNKTVDINKALTRGIGNALIIQPPKSKTSERTITLDNGTLQIMQQWKLEQSKYLVSSGLRSSKQLVFPADSTNKFMTSSQLRNNMLRVQTKAGLPKITVHGLRHTSTSLLFEAGVPMEVVKDRLGHSDIQTTMNIYTHVTKERQLETAEDFASFMESKTKHLSQSVHRFTTL